MRCLPLMVVLSITAILVVPAEARSQQIQAVDSVDIYVAALKMFNPPGWPRRQVRWLDVRLLSPADEKPGRIPDALLEELFARLGERFKLLDETAVSGPRSGGIVRIAILRMISADTAAVDAQYMHRTKYHMGPATNMTLLVARKGGQWRLLPQ